VGTDLHPHMPILHNAQNHYPLAAEHASWSIRPILGFRGSKVPQNVWFPALDADESRSKI